MTNPVTITNLSHDGRGIAQINGKTTFISNALPGETVEITYHKKHPKFDEASATKIIESAAIRIAPECPHFNICGGCSLQHLSSEAQISFKEKHLLEQLQHFGQVTPENILPPLLGPTFNYRRKARLGVKYVAKKNKVLVGFREKNSHFLADIDRCAVLADPVADLITPLKDLLIQLSVRDKIPQIEIAIGDDVTAIILRHLQALKEADKALLTEFAKHYNLYLYLQPGGLNSIQLLSPETGKTVITSTLPEFNLELFFKPNNFAQVNPAMNRQMVAKAIEFLAPDANDTILDLFCGFGNFTLALAKYAKHAVGIEGEASMIERARLNAEHNHITNIEFHVADLTKVDQAPWLQHSYNKILLDPPRSGALEILPLVAKMQAQKIVYISCNPATLARDAGVLVNQFGYRLKNTGVMDMFPQTSHVESIAVFEKAK